MYHPDNQDFYSCPGFEDAEKVLVKGTRMYFKQNSKKLIVFYHGNAGSACDRYFIKDRFEALGYSYLFVEYAGYSGDSRRPNKELLLKDVENVNEFIQDLNFEEVVLVGSSLGSAMVSYHSSLAEPDKIILFSAFDSVLNVAKRMYPVYPVKLLLKEDYDNVYWLNKYRGKLLMLHPTRDTVVVIKHGEQLFERLKLKEKKFVRLEGVGHNDLFFNADAWNAIESFLEE